MSDTEFSSSVVSSESDSSGSLSASESEDNADLNQPKHKNKKQKPSKQIATESTPQLNILPRSESKRKPRVIIPQKIKPVKEYDSNSKSKSKRGILNQEATETKDTNNPNQDFISTLLINVLKSKLENIDPEQKITQRFTIQSTIKEGSISCPIPYCQKQFTSKPGIIYHLKTYIHDLRPLLLVPEILLNHPDLESKINDTISINQFAVIFPNQKKPSEFTLFFALLEITPISSDKKNKQEYDIDPYPKTSQFTTPEQFIPVATLTLHQLNSMYPSSLYTVLERLPINSNSFIKNITTNQPKSNIQLPFLSSHSIINHNKKTTLFLNTGGPVWGLDWLPNNNSDEQYLACGGYTRYQNIAIGKKQTESEVGCFQIWKVVNCHATLNVVVWHTFGSIYDLKWCPYIKHNEILDSSLENEMLGYIAVSFSDGHSRIFSIPVNHNPITLHIEMSPIYDFHIQETLLWKIAWLNPFKIAFGCTNGKIALYSLSNFESNNQTSNTESNNQTSRNDILPRQVFDLCNYFQAHDSSIRSLFFISEYIIQSSSNDGRISLTDTRDTYQQATLTRCSTFILSSAYLPTPPSIAFSDIDYSLRIGNLDSLESIETTSFDSQTALATLFTSCHDECIWSISPNRYIPFIATCSADGTVRLGNQYRIGKRYDKQIIHTLYKLTHSESVEEYTENVSSREASSVFRVDKKKPHEMSCIQCIEFNPNSQYFEWIASGGVNGIVRIDSIFTIKTMK